MHPIDVRSRLQHMWLPSPRVMLFPTVTCCRDLSARVRRISP